MHTSGPLTGVTVVTLEQAVSAPIATRTLADLGARVIKVENPRGGDFARHYDDVVAGQAAHFVWCNRGKESVALNLRDARGKELLHALLTRADVLISNLAPGATERIGVAPEQLAQRHPHLVSTEITGYGQGGPLSHKRAYDLLVQAESGACSITGTEGAPAKAGPPMADVATGLYTTIAVLAALRGRRNGDPAANTHVAMLDVMTELMGYTLHWTRHTGVEQQPVGMGSPAVAPYGAYGTADGQTVVLGTTSDREWQRLAGDLLERPDLAADARYARNTDRVAARAVLDAIVGAWCAERDLADIQRRADAAGIGNARLNTVVDLAGHPQLAERGRWRDVDTSVGPVPAVLPPALARGWTVPRARVPTLGADTEAVRRELANGSPAGGEPPR